MYLQNAEKASQCPASSRDRELAIFASQSGGAVPPPRSRGSFRGQGHGVTPRMPQRLFSNGIQTFYIISSVYLYLYSLCICIVEVVYEKMWTFL